SSSWAGRATRRRSSSGRSRAGPTGRSPSSGWPAPRPGAARAPPPGRATAACSPTGAPRTPSFPSSRRPAAFSRLPERMSNSPRGELLHVLLDPRLPERLLLPVQLQSLPDLARQRRRAAGRGEGRGLLGGRGRAVELTGRRVGRGQGVEDEGLPAAGAL